FSSRRRHTRFSRDWSSDVCSSDLDTTRLTLAALASLSLLHSLPIAAHENDDPLLSKVMIDQLEWRNADDEDPYALDAQAWIGKDLHKLWLKLDVEHREGATEEAEIQALYSRAITPFWDLQDRKSTRLNSSHVKTSYAVFC